MGLFRPRTWRWKSVWDVANWALLGLGALTGACVAFLPHERKQAPALVGAAFVVLGGLTKLFSQMVDDREKAAKATREEEDRAAAAAREQKRDAEVADARARAAAQIQRVAKAVLAHMHEHFFEQEADKEKHKHRVTLFVCREGAGPGGCKQWLAVYAREGPFSTSTCAWPLDEDSPAKCRGVAGKIWFHNTTEFITAACDWPEGDDPEAKARYAQSLDIAVEEAEKLNIKSLMFAGSVVMVRGAKWGVLLVDSRKDWRSSDKGVLGRQRKRLERYATLLRRVIEEGQE